jgi:hypothetical protein
MVDKDNTNLIIQFVSWALLGDHVEYQIHLFNDKLSAEFTHRYSSLRDFHEAVKNEAKDPNLPKFPPKKFFGNTDKQFLNQRMVGLQHYFSSILSSKDFSNLKSVRTWVNDIIKKYGKAKVSKSSPTQSNTQMPAIAKVVPELKNTDNEQPATVKVLNQELIAKRKEIAEKYSKNFIELSGDNVPPMDEEQEKKEKSYKAMMKNSVIYEIKNSDLFSLLNGDDSNFNHLGEENNNISRYESFMLSKIEKLVEEIKINIPAYYDTRDFMVDIPVSTK